MQKLKVKNRAKSPRGFIVNGGSIVLIEPGETGEVELEDATADVLKASSDAGGDVEVLSSSIQRATMKKGG